MKVAAYTAKGRGPYSDAAVNFTQEGGLWLVYKFSMYVLYKTITWLMQFHQILQLLLALPDEQMDQLWYHGCHSVWKRLVGSSLDILSQLQINLGCM